MGQHSHTCSHWSRLSVSVAIGRGLLTCHKAFDTPVLPSDDTGTPTCPYRYCVSYCGNAGPILWTCCVPVPPCNSIAIPVSVHDRCIQCLQAAVWIPLFPSLHSPSTMMRECSSPAMSRPPWWQRHICLRVCSVTVPL